MKYKFGGYGKYLEEMERLEQLPGLPKKFRDRPLEGDTKSGDKVTVHNTKATRKRKPKKSYVPEGYLRSNQPIRQASHG
jgi:hypothetical protein